MGLSVEMAGRLGSASAMYQKSWSAMETASRALADDAPVLAKVIKRGVKVDAELPAVVRRVANLDAAQSQVVRAHEELRSVMAEASSELRLRASSAFDTHLGAALADLRYKLPKPNVDVSYWAHQRGDRLGSIINYGLMGVTGGAGATTLAMAAAGAGSTSGLMTGAFVALGATFIGEGAWMGRIGFRHTVDSSQYVRLLADVTEVAAAGTPAGRMVGNKFMSARRLSAATEELAAGSRAAHAQVREQLAGIVDQVQIAATSRFEREQAVVSRTNALAGIRADATTALREVMTEHDATMGAALRELASVAPPMSAPVDTVAAAAAARAELIGA